MSAWAPGPFDNEEAADFIDDLTTGGDPAHWAPQAANSESTGSRPGWPGMAIACEFCLNTFVGEADHGATGRTSRSRPSFTL